MRFPSQRGTTHTHTHLPELSYSSLKRRTENKFTVSLCRTTLISSLPRENMCRKKFKEQFSHK